MPEELVSKLIWFNIAISVFFIPCVVIQVSKWNDEAFVEEILKPKSKQLFYSKIKDLSDSSLKSRLERCNEIYDKMDKHGFKSLEEEHIKKKELLKEIADKMKSLEEEINKIRAIEENTSNREILEKTFNTEEVLNEDVMVGSPLEKFNVFLNDTIIFFNNIFISIFFVFCFFVLNNNFSTKKCLNFILIIENIFNFSFNRFKNLIVNRFKKCFFYVLFFYNVWSKPKISEKKDAQKTIEILEENFENLRVFEKNLENLKIFEEKTIHQKKLLIDQLEKVGVVEEETHEQNVILEKNINKQEVTEKNIDDQEMLGENVAGSPLESFNVFFNNIIIIFDNIFISIFFIFLFFVFCFFVLNNNFSTKKCLNFILIIKNIFNFFFNHFKNLIVNRFKKCFFYVLFFYTLVYFWIYVYNGLR